MAEAKLVLNTLWGQWQRVDTMCWQQKKKTDEDRAAVETPERLDPRVKCSLWRWAITRSGVSASDASYLDVLDEHIVTYIVQLSSWGVVQDKKEMGWANLHQEFRLLPRCPVHETVIIYFLLYSGYTKLYTFFLLDHVGVVERPENHLVSMSSPHRSTPAHPLG